MVTHARNSGLALLLVLAASSSAFAQWPLVESVSTTGVISGGSTEIDIPAPSGVAEGDLLVACASAFSDDLNEIQAGGWTTVATSINVTNGAKVGMLWKAWESTDDSTYTFTLAAVTVTARRGLMWRISGANTDDASNATASEAGTLSTARTYASILTGTANTLALGCVSWTTNDVNYTPEGTLTNDVLIQRLAGDHRAIEEGGITTGALSGTGANAGWASVFWAVADSVAASTGTKRCTTLGVC
jgi:hypothetical protein